MGPQPERVPLDRMTDDEVMEHARRLYRCFPAHETGLLGAWGEAYAEMIRRGFGDVVTEGGRVDMMQLMDSPELN